jgi:hypothetical protein
MSAEHHRNRHGGSRGGDAGQHAHRRIDAVRVAVRGTRTSGAKPRVEAERDQIPTAPSALELIRDWWPGAWGRIVRLFRRPARVTSHVLPRARWARRLGLAVIAIIVVVLAAAGALWGLLAIGPISLDIATPWLKDAISANFGNQFNVEVGGTVLERDEHGRTAMRIRGVVVRDRDGNVIASAPKAEVGFASASLFSGHPRAERLNLVGAELGIRVEPDGRITVSAGADKRPLATTPVIVEQRGAATAARGAEHHSAVQENFAAFLGWVDSLSALGLDGADLSEIGLKSGNLIVDDRRNGTQSRFENIHLSLTRPRAGVLELQLGSDDAARPWSLTASLKPGVGRTRSLAIEANQISIRDLMLAMRIDGGTFEADGSVSAALKAEIEPDGTPQFINGRVLLG